MSIVYFGVIEWLRILNIECSYRVFLIFCIYILFLQVSNVASAEAPAEQWNRSFGGDDKDNSRCVEQTSDGGYIVTGTKDSYGKGSDGQSDARVVKLAGEGEGSGMQNLYHQRN